MRLVPLLMKKNRCGRCLVSMLTIMALIVSSFVLPVHTLKSGAAESTSSYGLSNPTISNGVTTWDCIYFGNYYQSNSSTKEPIKWRVLSVNGNDAFLLADQNLDAKPYNEKYTDVTWATCTLRTWLNDTFLNTAFTLAEQAAIRNTTVVNDDNPYCDTEGGENTTDKVYLLSIAEACNTTYGFDGEFEWDSETREAKNTAYAKRASTTYELDSDWWLRSPGYDSTRATLVYSNGCGVNHANITVYSAVRPTLHLNLSATTLWSYAGEVTAGVGDNLSQATEPPVVSDRDESLGTVTKGADLSLGSNKSGKLSAEVSEFFPANWSLGTSVFPVTLSQKTKADGSYSVKMAIGVGKTNMLDSKTEWSRYKQVVNDAEKYASLTGLLYRYAPVKRSTYSVSKFNKMPSLSAVGYMEQEYDKYGNLISSTGKIAPELAWKASVNWQFASPIGPWYASLAGGGKIAGELGPKYTFSTKKWTLDGKLSLKPEISLEGGYGINKIITAGVGGKLSGDLQLLPKSSCSATASAYIHLYCAFLVDWQHDLKSATFKLWSNPNKFNQKNDGWTCSLIDDSFAEKTSAWNHKAASQPIAKLKQNGQTDSMTESTLQSGILTSSLPIIKEINGTKVMIFQGYDSERSELNRTVLQYSVCKNGSWTEPKAVFGNGYADMYADMAVADGKLVLAWQKEKSEIEGSVSDGANTILNDVAKKSEIWTAVFDEASGTFKQTTQLTNNDKPDMMPKVSEGSDGAAVTWLRSSSEDYVENEGTTTICRQTLGSSKAQEIASTTKEVKEYAVYKEDGTNHAVYLTENENGESQICDEADKTLISSGTDEGTIAGLQYANGKLLYNRNGKMYELKDGEGTELTDDENSIPSSAIYCKNGDYEGFVWIANDDETGEGSIKVSMKTEDGFSEPVTVYTGKDKRIQYLSPVLESDGQWEFAANVLNQSTNLNELLVISKTPQTELTLAGASIDEYDVEDDLTAVHYYATNTELTPIEELIVRIQLEDGTEVEKTISQTVQPGETVSGTAYMNLSDVTNPQTASVYVYAKGQTDLTKNQVSVSVGKSDIRLTNTVEEKGSQAVITATLENVSDRTATTTLKLYSDEKKSKQLYMSEEISIEPWKRVTKTITVNKSDLSYNANQAVYMLLHADVAEGDCDESNNDSYAILYQAKTNTNTNTNSQTSSFGTGNAGKKQSTSSKTVKVKAPSKVKLTSAKNGKGKKLTVKWKKITGAKGYQLQYAMNKKFKKKKSVQTKKTKYTIKKLKKNKTYYIRVRAYKMNGRKKVYGKWSKVKKVKIKK
ncbi:DUF6273 domain-containing protein [Clostridium sp. AF36-4]|jgi:hypothetical protein|uniref:DUF6273 domain-containing protein n=1 Tax=Clostridium sp. AF36-4 TaxID=2293015 RepID=UPI000E3F6162|nr:DUF6273 domain-containing protein [Clostridium sp. AF36-4]RGF54797.1 hypothetical protein DW005_08810 [Clostridium sp. AF36-4]